MVLNMELRVLGSGQDAGIPQIGCLCPVCERARRHRRHRRLGPSIGIIDPETGSSYIVDASPDLKHQVDMLRDGLPSPAGNAGFPISGILLTHAHAGHYTGLWQLGQEALDADRVPVFCTPRMREFLLATPALRRLLQRENIQLHEIEPGTRFALGKLACIAVQVPHRAEFSDTVGFVIQAGRRAIYIPDVDRWTDEVIEEINKSDIALVDGTFFSADEIKRFAEVPHPPIRETARLLEDTDAEVYFTHINHTNIVNIRGPERRRLAKRGFEIAHDGLKLTL